MAQPDLVMLQYVACQLPSHLFLDALVDRFMLTGWFRMPFLVREAAHCTCSMLDPLHCQPSP